MSYFKPYIDESGFHYPTYNEILEQLVDDMQTIFGSGIYLGNDSQDYQMLSKFAEKIYDSYQTCEIVYLSRSPVTSIGAGLDYIVAINGIARKQGTKSTVTVTLEGTAGTVIYDGAVADTNGHVWDLPATVIIGDEGSVDVEAVCRDVGVVQASPDSVIRIMTPTLGWTSVTNGAEASTGTVTETDSELRARQADSTAQPSQSMVQGLKGALASLPDVERCEVYENDKPVTNAAGIPANSVCAVVEGGDDDEIASTILLRKGLGCGTFGSTAVTTHDSDGEEYEIHFSRPVYVDVDVQIEISAKAGYTTAIPDEITGVIANYLNEFNIGADLTTSILWMVAQQINSDIRNPAFSVVSLRAARHGEELSQADIAFAYNEVARGNAAYINVIVV